MAGENDGTTVDDAVEENDDDFNAGFTGSDAPPTETPAAAPPPEAKLEPTPEPTPAPAEAPKYVQITEDDWNRLNTRAAKIDEIGATLDKRFDTAFGKMGDINRVLAKLQAETPAGVTPTVDEKDFAELRAEYPELAETTIKGLNQVLSKFKGTGDTAAIEKMVNERLETAVSSTRKEIVTASLEAVFPGWTEDVQTEQFQTWLKGQTTEVQALAQSDHVRDAARLLRLYEGVKNAPAPAPKPPPAAPVSARQRQIAAAIPPKGDGGHPSGPEEEDEFNAGFNYRKGK